MFCFNQTVWEESPPFILFLNTPVVDKSGLHKFVWYITALIVWYSVVQVQVPKGIFAQEQISKPLFKIT